MVKSKKIARIIYNIYHNFWIELIGTMVLFLILLINLFLILIGTDLSEKVKDFNKKERIFVISEIFLFLFLYLIYKWAKSKINDELKKEGLLYEEENE